jgi:hypothetical protein
LIIALSFILNPTSHPTTSAHADPFKLNLVSAGIECPGMKSGARVQARIPQFHSPDSWRSSNSRSAHEICCPWGPIQISTLGKVAIPLTSGRASSGMSFHITTLARSIVDDSVNDGMRSGVIPSSHLRSIRGPTCRFLNLRQWVKRRRVTENKVQRVVPLTLRAGILGCPDRTRLGTCPVELGSKNYILLSEGVDLGRMECAKSLE